MPQSPASPTRRLLAGLLAALALLAAPHAASAASATPQTVTAASPYATLVDRLADTDRAVLASYTTKDSPADIRFYDDGVWMDASGDCWTCFSAAATDAAVLSRDGGADAALRARAIRTYDRSISDHQNADGSFSGSTSGPGIDTGFWIQELGKGYLVLGDQLDAATRTRWATAIGRAADYLIAAGHTRWYVNGNMNLRYAEDLWLAWKATGEPRFKQAYEDEWAFLMDPPQARWPGYGLQLVARPSRADGSDGKGYLAEAGTEGPGYDPAYTLVQVDVAAEIYILNKDPRALRLMNLEVNQLLDRVDANWTLDASSGSRKSYITPFMTPAMTLLARTGTRPDLAARLYGQYNRIINEYKGAMGYTHPNFYRGLGSWLALPLLDRQLNGGDMAIPAQTSLSPATSGGGAAAKPADAPSAKIVVSTKSGTASAPPAAKGGATSAAPVTATPVGSAAPAAAWALDGVAQAGTTLFVQLKGVAGASKVTAEIFATTAAAKAAKSSKKVKPLARATAKGTAGRFTVTVPLKRVAKSGKVALRLTVVDGHGRRSVVTTVRVKKARR